MKRVLIFISFISIFSFLTFKSFAQDAAVKIDGQVVYLKSGNSLPYWLKAGQTITPSKNVSFLSAMEFNSDSNSHVLKYVQVIKIANLSTVPTGKVWKIEAVAYDTFIVPTNMASVQLPSNGGIGSSITSGGSAANTPVLYKSPKVFDVPGTYQWIVPPGVTSICVEIWGGGGNGDMDYAAFNVGRYYPGSGGGAGGYGYQCFNVIPGTQFSLTIGGACQSSLFGNLLIATAGGSGSHFFYPNGSYVSNYGLGGNCNATFNVNGLDGAPGNGYYVINGAYPNQGGKGGAAYNGGAGGTPQIPTPNGNCCNGVDGQVPGGGGSGVSLYTTTPSSQGIGAPGKIIVYW